MSLTQELAERRTTPEVQIDGIRPKERAWIEWLRGTDHKRTGMLFIGAAFVFFVVGCAEALLMRLQLGIPDNTFLSPQAYSELFTLHGTTMVFLFMLPVLAGLTTYLVPLMIGARSIAFPRLAMLAWWLFVIGALVLYGSIMWSTADAGWTNYPTLSEKTFMPTSGINALIVAVYMISLSTLLTSINLIATIKNMRTAGMVMSRLPLFCWTALIFAVCLLLVTPVLLAALTLLMVDRHYGGSFFLPDAGGSPLLWQHLFWFYTNPALYFMVLPAFGIVSEVLSVFSRKPIFGYRTITLSSATLAFLVMLGWGQHMFTSPLSTSALVFFTITALLVAVPASVNVFNWIATLWKGTLEFKVPMLFALGFIAMFILSTLAGIVTALFPLASQTANSYFDVAQLHYIVFGGTVFALFAGIYYWFPKFSGKTLSPSLGRISFWLMFIGFNVAFLLMYSLGLAGMVARTYEYSSSSGFEAQNLISTIGAFVLVAGIVVTLFNVLYNIRRGSKSVPDPWQANTLEWFTESPPPPHNFDKPPVVRSLMPMHDYRIDAAGRRESA